MNINLNGTRNANLPTAGERTNSPRRNAIANGFRNTAATPSVKIDNSLLELMRNYKTENSGEKPNAFNPEEAYNKFNAITSKHEQLIAPTPIDWDVKWDSIRDGYLFTGSHFLDPTLDAANSDHYFRELSFAFSSRLSMAWNDGGMGNFMLEFARISEDLRGNFNGEELTARMAALERAFLHTGDVFAAYHAFTQVMIEHPDYTDTNDPNIKLTSAQLRANARLEREANNLIDHIGSMFRAALDFFNANGNFTGFLDTAAANVPDRPSLRDFSENF